MVWDRFLVRVSYLEIYNEEVRDILHKPSRNPPKLEIRERADIGVYVKDLQSFVVKNADEMDKLMTIGNQNSKKKTTPNIEPSCSFFFFFLLQGWLLLRT